MFIFRARRAGRIARASVRQVRIGGWVQSGTQRDPPQIRSASVEPDIACAHVDACRSRDACIHTYYARTCAYMHKHGLPPETHSSRLQKRIRLVFFRQIGLRQSRQVAHRMTTRIQTPVRTRVSTWKASAPTWKASALSPLDSAMPSHPAHRLRSKVLNEHPSTPVFTWYLFLGLASDSWY